MKTKLYYITCGYIFLIGNILLLGTRFNLVGLGFGIVAGTFFIKSLLVKKDGDRK